jgi:hypothetical protein
VARYAYRPEWFRHDALVEMAAAARRGPLLWASHSCYMHAPLHLSLREAMRLEGWWALPPIELEGAGNVFTDESSGGHRRVADLRLGSVREEEERWLRDLDRQDVLGTALVVVLSDHGQRVSWVSDEDREHVQLAMFAPGEARSAVVRTPVSLVDLAPTVRRHLGLPAVASAGVALPLDNPVTLAHRAVGHIEAAKLDSMGIRLNEITAADVARALEFKDDGTYCFLPGLNDASRHDLRFVDRGSVPAAAAELRGN